MFTGSRASSMKAIEEGDQVSANTMAAGFAENTTEFRLHKFVDIRP